MLGYSYQIKYHYSLEKVKKKKKRSTNYMFEKIALRNCQYITVTILEIHIFY